MKLNANHPRLNYILGLEAVANKKPEVAVTYYLKAIENYPKEDRFHLNETYNNLGSVYYSLGNIKDAKESWENALVLFPTDQLTRENLNEFIYENSIIPIEMREIPPFIKKFINKRT